MFSFPQNITYIQEQTSSSEKSYIFQPSDWPNFEYFPGKNQLR